MTARTLISLGGICYCIAFWMLLRDNGWHIGIVPIIFFIIHIILDFTGGASLQASLQEEVEIYTAEKMNDIGNQLNTQLQHVTTEIRLLRTEVKSLRQKVVRGASNPPY